MAIIDKPSDYFNTKLYTGTGSSNSVTGVGFQPDFTWVKARGNTTWHYLYDAVRTAGTGKELHSNSTAAEGASNSSLYGYLSSFNSDGFSTVIGSNASSDGLNKNGTDFASWNWKAGTSFTNDASATGIGSIDSTGSASDTSGFSIVSYTGTGSAGTIKHGLSSVPYMIIVKKRSATGSWNVYHSSLGNTKAIQLDLTSTPDTNSGYWNNTSPTSSVLSLGTSAQVNGSGVTYIGYIFSEKQAYSKFGSYTGNGNADGTFVYTGQKSAFIMLKNTTRAASWLMYDNKRLGYNVDNNELVANTNAAEETYDQIDILSNGFKMRANGTSTNLNGDTYIYMAFAENPFVASNFNAATAR